MRVAAIQLASAPGDAAGNRDRADALLARAAAAGADLALLPELALTGYVLGPRLWTHAEPVGGPLTSWLCDRARRHRLHLGTTIVEAAGAHFHNSFVLADPAGAVAGVVRKSRPAWIEARWYSGSPGSHHIDTALGRIGVGICYENYLAGTVRTLAAASVDLVLQPTAAATPPAAWPVGARGAAAFDRMLTRLVSDHARMLGVPVVMANQCGGHATPGLRPGRTLPTRFPGLSSIVDGAGEVLASLGAEEGVIIADVTPDRARPHGIARTRYWAAPTPWYAPAWPVAQHLSAVGYRLDRSRRAAALAKGGGGKDIA